MRFEKRKLYLRNYRKLKQTKTKQLQKTGTFDISIHCLGEFTAINPLKKYDIIN